MTPLPGGLLGVQEITVREGRLRQIYPTAGPDFHFRVDESEGGREVSIDGVMAGLQIVSGATGAGGLQRGWIRDESGQRQAFAAGWVGDSLHLWLDGRQYVFEPVTAQSAARSVGPEEGDALAPMPGTVVQVLAAAGQEVERLAKRWW